MTLALALGGALFYGLGDFSGGFAAKRNPPWGVMAWSQTVGLATLGAGLLMFPADRVTSADLAWGAAAGIGGAVGIGLLYRSLAEGTMAVVSPMTAATTAALPVLVDLVSGAELSLVAAIGVIAAILAIATIATERSERRLSPRLIGMALAAGSGFAMFFIAIAQTTEASGFWPLVAARVVTIPLGVILHRSIERPMQLAVGRWWIVAAGTLDMGANLLVAAALQQGPLGIVSVLSSLYPVATALAAVLILHERLSRIQLTGVALAMVAVVLLVS